MESELPDIEDEYKRLLYLHRRLFELKEPKADSSKSFLSMKTPLNSACRLPRKNISSIKMVHKPYKIAICLPPKCGTTNWQKAMNVLEKDAKHKPPPSGEKYWKPEEFGYPDVYNILRNADITDKKDSKMISGWTKILNTRIGSLKSFSENSIWYFCFDSNWDHSKESVHAAILSMERQIENSSVSKRIYSS